MSIVIETTRTGKRMHTTIPPSTESLLREIRFIEDLIKSVGGFPTYYSTTKYKNLSTEGIPSAERFIFYFLKKYYVIRDRLRP
jgi:hypothetical protein